MVYPVSVCKITHFCINIERRFFLLVFFCYKLSLFNSNLDNTIHFGISHIF